MSTASSIPRFSMILALLAAIGPFAIDTYMPAFGDMQQAFGVTAVQMQASLTVYSLTFALMCLVHGPISDAIGRRPVILAGMSLFALASLGAALSSSLPELLVWRALQGCASGAGASIARASARDYAGAAESQRILSQATIAFALAPVIAPILGGWLLYFFGWRSIFIFLVLYSAALFGVVWRYLPETLSIDSRRPLEWADLFKGYFEVFTNRRFLILVGSLVLLMSGFLMYVFSAPHIVPNLFGQSAQSYYVLFVPLTIGTMTGAAVSNRFGRIYGLRKTSGLGLAVASVAALVQFGLAVLIDQGHLPMLPIAVFGLFFLTFGAAIALSPLQVLLMDTVPERKGMVSSCAVCLQSLAIGLIAVLVLPLIWQSLSTLAAFGLVLNAIAALLFLIYVSRFAASQTKD